MLDRIRAVPSLNRSTTAAAVSSQVVSIPSTNVLTSLAKLVPTFRSSYSIAAPTFYELRKVMGTKPIDSGAAFHLNFLDEFAACGAGTSNGRRRPLYFRAIHVSLFGSIPALYGAILYTGRPPHPEEPCALRGVSKDGLHYGLMGSRRAKRRCSP